MAQSDPFFEGALAPARWPHELEKPNPGFGRGGVAGVSGFGALRLGRVARRPILRRASGSGDLVFAGLWYAVWHFVRRPFPALDENPLLDLMNYHTPTFYGWVLLWYYVSPFAAVMLAGLLVMSIWKVWFESRGRDFATFGGLNTRIRFRR